MIALPLTFLASTCKSASSNDVHFCSKERAFTLSFFLANLTAFDRFSLPQLGAIRSAISVGKSQLFPGDGGIAQTASAAIYGGNSVIAAVSAEQRVPTDGWCLVCFALCSAKPSSVYSPSEAKFKSRAMEQSRLSRRKTSLSRLDFHALAFLISLSSVKFAHGPYRPSRVVSPVSFSKSSATNLNLNPKVKEPFGFNASGLSINLRRLGDSSLSRLTSANLKGGIREPCTACGISYHIHAAVAKWTGYYNTSAADGSTLLPTNASRPQGKSPRAGSQDEAEHFTPSIFIRPS